MAAKLTTSIIIHVSDTHFATNREALVPAGGRSGLLGAIESRLLANEGCNRQDPKLWRVLIRFLRRFNDRRCMLVHTGDLTQAGQHGSFGALASALGGATGDIPAIFIPGNHDYWPRCFPIFSPADTATQRTVAMARIQQVQGPLPYERRTQWNSSVEFVALDSAVADSLYNAFAVGEVANVWCHLGGAYRPQVAPQRVSARVGIALVHHPLKPLLDGTSPIFDQLRGATAGTVFDLRNPSQLEQQLLTAGISIVLSGHEHKRLTVTPLADGKILQLCVGTPVMNLRNGSSTEPHVGVYALTSESKNRVSIHVLRFNLTGTGWSDLGEWRWGGTAWTTHSPQCDLSFFPREIFEPEWLLP